MVKSGTAQSGKSKSHILLGNSTFETQRQRISHPPSKHSETIISSAARRSGHEVSDINAALEQLRDEGLVILPGTWKFPCRVKNAHVESRVL